jgi:hypothetical protein
MIPAKYNPQQQPMTYDVILPETAQEHKVPLIPKHNNIYKKIFNALPVIHKYQACIDVLKLNIEFPKYFPNFFYTTMTLTFIYYKLIKIHCCKSITQKIQHTVKQHFSLCPYLITYSIYISTSFLTHCKGVSCDVVTGKEVHIWQ